MRRQTHLALVALGVGTLVLGPATAAFSAPVKAPNTLAGTADCGPDGSFSFLVVETGGEKANTWSPAFITGADGETGVFIPASIDVTFTSPFGTDVDRRAKATAPGPVVCTISASPAPGFELAGTVTGRIVTTG